MVTLKKLNIQIRALQKEILYVGALFQDKTKKIDKLIALRKKLVGATSIKDLPPEILHRIFQQALPSEGFDHRTERLRTNIRLVSSQWNETMLSDPALWTSVFISFLTDSHEPDVLSLLQDEYFRSPEIPGLRTTAEEALARIRRRITHSRDLPMDLVLTHVAGSMAVCNEPPLGLARLIQETKWRSMSIQLHPDLRDRFLFLFDVFKPCYRLPAAAWASLQSLHLTSIVGKGFVFYVRAGDPYEGIPSMVMTAEEFPNLRDVSLEMSMGNLLKWELPWAQLTSLELHGFRNSFADYLPILGKCRILQELSIHIELPNRTDALEPAPAVIGAERLVTLPRLHSLSLEIDIKCDVLTALVSKLILPGLRSLNYKNTTDTDVGGVSGSIEVLEALSKLVQRSSVPLCSLTLRLLEMTLDDAAFCNLLTLITHVTHLELAAQRLTCDFLTALKQPPFIDNLQTVLISNLCQSGQVNPKSKFAHWAEPWARNQEGKKRTIEAGYMTGVLQGPARRAERDRQQQRGHPPKGHPLLRELREEGYNVWEDYVLD